MIGNMRFPPIGEHPYLFALGPHNFYWFKLSSAEEAPERRGEGRR